MSRVIFHVNEYKCTYTHMKVGRGAVPWQAAFMTWGDPDFHPVHAVGFATASPQTATYDLAIGDCKFTVNVYTVCCKSH